MHDSASPVSRSLWILRQRNAARMDTYLYHEFIAINNTFNQPITPREIARAKKSSYSAQTKDGKVL